VSFREPYDAAAIGAAIYAAEPDMDSRTRHLIEHLLRMLSDRDRALEDFISTGGAGSGGGIPPFTYPGPLAAGIESCPWYAPVPFEITQIRASLLAAATATNTFELHLNGAVVAGSSVSITAGNKTITAALTVEVVVGDILTVVATAVADSNATIELATA
jgi:hypothetical protein